MAKREMWELQQKQSLPLNLKISLTKARIRQWINEYGEDGVAVSFSGGKDSTVLLDLVRQDYPDVKAVFFDTGLEYPEIREFVKTFDNVEWIKPKMNFKDIITTYGYPMISKEVSECVQGARKYLTSILQNETVLTDRQTDRQHNYSYFYDKLTGQGKYRKLRGIGEFAKRENGKQNGRSESKTSNNVRVVDEQSRDQDEYP